MNGPAPGSGRAGLVLVVLLAVACWPPAAALLTLHQTVLDAGFYRSALDRVDFYDRVYDDVLTDPELADVTDELLADLPVDGDLVVDNLRTVVPASTLRGFTDDLSDRVAGYLDGDRDELALAVDLRPVFDNVGRLASVYLAGEVSGAPRYRTEDVSAAVTDVLAGLDRVSRGVPPVAVPEVDLTDSQRDWVASLLLGRVPEADRPAAAVQVHVALRSGDLGGALAVVGPLIFSGGPRAVADLRGRLEGGSVLNLGRPLESAPPNAGIRALTTVHGLGGTGLLATAVPLALAPAAALAVLLLGVRRPGARRHPVTRARASHSMIAMLAAGGLAALVAGALLPLVIGDPVAPLTGTDSPLPPAARVLASDIEGAMIDGVVTSWLRLASMPLLLALFAAFVLGVVPRAARQFAIRAGRRRRWVALGTASTMFVAGSWVLVPGEAGTGTAFCNGGAELCDRRYSEVVYPTTHNAMASVEAGFLGAVQDPDLSGQLDNGARALLLDVHHWTTPAQVEVFLDGLRPSAREALAPFATGARSARPGLWLCHGICQLGALRFADALAEIADWMARNPSEVITLILQDAVPPGEVMAAFRVAGLDRRLAVPPAEGEPWPTLGKMIDSGRRLVVFAENADVPGTWYRRFFRDGADTPFNVRFPGGFSCALTRGPEEPAMVLVNHWLTEHTASRSDAALVNTAESLTAHVRRCAARGLRPTFVAVNYATIGDLIPTVDALNKER